MAHLLLMEEILNQVEALKSWGLQRSKDRLCKISSISSSSSADDMNMLA